MRTYDRYRNAQTRVAQSAIFNFRSSRHFDFDLLFGPQTVLWVMIGMIENRHTLDICISAKAGVGRADDVRMRRKTAA